MNTNELELVVGDITKQTTNVIVNAANGSLLGGGGVDGAIHQAAGKDLLEECKHVRETNLNGERLPTGEAILTKGYQLQTDYVIHTVGPIWNGSTNHVKQEEQLAACYMNSLKLAQNHKLTSISFPSISTGVYQFPINLAAKTALKTIIKFLEHHTFGTVVITLFSKTDYVEYKNALKKLIDQ